MTDQKETGSAQLAHRIENATTELSDLYRDLYWLVHDQSGPEQEQTIRDLNFDQIMDLKLAVDNLRDMLWKYIDAATVAEPGRVREAMEVNQVRRVTRLLQLLRERLGRVPDPQPVSFIERVSAAIQEKLAATDRKAV